MKKLSRFILLLVGFVVLTSGCTRGASPEGLSFKGTSIVVWDVKEPHLPGASPYSEVAAGIVADFAASQDVKVELLFKSRLEIEQALCGGDGEKPDIIFSTETPHIGHGAQNLRGLISENDYITASIAYWSRDEETIMAIPSYAHWVCLATRGEGQGMKNNIGYFLDGKGFLDTLLQDEKGRWAAETIIEAVEWLKTDFGQYYDAPLARWADHDLSGLFPVTPHLLKWLRLSEQDSSVEINPIPSPRGSAQFYFTVPGYIVLAEDNANKQAACELGKLLAAAKGRWAARAIGGIPCFNQDMAVYYVESSLHKEEALSLAETFDNTGFKVLDLDEFMSKEKKAENIVDLIEQYLSQNLSKEEFEAGIHQAVNSHTSNQE